MSADAGVLSVPVSAKDDDDTNHQQISPYHCHYTSILPIVLEVFQMNCVLTFGQPKSSCSRVTAQNMFQNWGFQTDPNSFSQALLGFHSDTQ